MKKNGTGRKVVQMLQSGPQDNGQTALAMVLTCLGCPVSPWELEPVESAADLVNATRARGLYAEGCRMTARELCAAPLPAIAHWQFRSFVVVSRVRGRRVWVNDPEKGLRVLTVKEFEAGFTGAAVCFAGQGGEGQEALPPRARAFFARFPAAALLLGVAQALISVCCVAAVIFLRLLAEGVSGMPALFLLAAVLLPMAALFQAALLRRCEAKLRQQVSRYCAAGLEKKSPLFFRRVPAYQTAYACESCGTAGAAAAGLGLHTMRLWTAAVCLALMAVQDVWSAVAAAVIAAVFAGAARGQEELLCSEAKRAGRDRFVLNHQTARLLDRMDSLRNERRRDFEQWLYEAGGQEISRASKRLDWYWLCFAAVEVAAVLCICLLRTAAGQLRLEMLAGCGSTAVFFAGAMGALPRWIEERAVLRAVRETFDGLFRENPDRKAESAGAEAPDSADELTVQSVELPSQEGEAGFRGVSLKARRGEVLSVQVTGGDRLALSRLIAGIAIPTQGAVYIGGADLRELRETELYRCVILLGRGVPVPSGTVRENIAAGCGDISDFDIVQAASSALLHERMLLREKGYDTPVKLLSSGEQVLLEFACAFARGTPFLVVDACTRQLDRETERTLLAAARARGAGVILVADRGEPFRWADAVCRIEDGRVTLMERTEIVDWEGQTLVRSK